MDTREYWHPRPRHCGKKPSNSKNLTPIQCKRNQLEHESKKQQKDQGLYLGWERQESNSQMGGHDKTTNRGGNRSPGPNKKTRFSKNKNATKNLSPKTDNHGCGGLSKN